MKYTEEELEYILEKKPELKIKPIPSLDDVIVEFLKKYEVFVKPITSNKKNIGQAILGGAVTGMSGIDAGGDVFLVSGQEKQTKVQEWTQWKQWALDHKDFETFRAERIDKIKEHNENIDKKLEDPSIKEEFDPIFKEWRKKEEQEEKDNEKYEQLLKMIVMPFAIITILIVGYVVYTSGEDNSTFYRPVIKSDKIQDYIS
tara:strand:+ start:1763 stop:2365 length:603 start_codon:yes stop_codon:yes gene_type:complete